jgi:hypothetical protein
MLIELKVAKESDARLWDKVVESSPFGTIFHTWRCLKIIEKYSKTELYPLIVERDSVPIGCVPLFYQKKLWMKLLFSPPPHAALQRLGPLLPDDEGPRGCRKYRKESDTIEFQKKVHEFIVSAIKPDYLTLSCAYLQDSRCYIWNGYDVRPTYNYIFRLDDELDKIWSGIKRNTRQDIQRAQKRGLSFREGGKEDMLSIYDLLLERYAQQKKTVREPKEYLLEMYEAFHPDNLRVFVVEHKGNVITGSIDVYYDHRVISWIGNPKAVEHANDLLTWECLRWSHDHGFRYYQIMGVAGNERLYSFYSKFNPDMVVSFSAKRYSSFVSKLLSDIVEKSASVKRWLNIV